MPAPEPTGLYCTEWPNAEPSAGVQVETSGETKELPAPLIVVSLLVAVAAVATTRAAATAVSVIINGLVMRPMCLGRRRTWADGVLPPCDGPVTGPRPACAVS